jgi:hypothetical protein
MDHKCHSSTLRLAIWMAMSESEKIKVTKTKTGGVDRDSESDHSVVSKSLTTHPSDLSET